MQPYKYNDAENMMPRRNVSLLSSKRTANSSSPITRAARASCCISSSSRRATRMMLPSKISVLAATCTSASRAGASAQPPVSNSLYRSLNAKAGTPSVSTTRDHACMHVCMHKACQEHANSTRCRTLCTGSIFHNYKPATQTERTQTITEQRPPTSAKLLPRLQS